MNADGPGLTNRAAYEAVDSSGKVCGAIGPRDWDRFRQTLKFIPRDIRSLLDVGCDRGHWLSFVTRHRRLEDSLGIDVSAARVAEAKGNYPHLEFATGYLEELEVEPGRFEVVTALEVLEHIPDWLGVLNRLLRVARRRVVISVPYRERRQETICIHCGKATPLHGHLRSYDESTFPAVPGWNLQFGYIWDRGVGSRPARRIYRGLIPRRNWLVACYDAAERPDRQGY